MYHTWILLVQVCTVASHLLLFFSSLLLHRNTEFLLLREQLPRSEKHTDKVEKDKAPGHRVVESVVDI